MSTLQTNLEALLISIEGMTADIAITPEQQKILAKEMMEYYEIQMKVIPNERQVKTMLLQVLKIQIQKMKASINME